MPAHRSASHRRTFTALSLALLLAAAVSPAASQELRSTLDGVYTNEQADEGAKTFAAICTRCHTEGTPLEGPSFLAKWTNRSLYQLWEYMSTRMPYGAPGTLSSEEYLGMLAWILRENGYPAGDTPLPDANLGGIFYEIGQINLVPPPDRE